MQVWIIGGAGGRFATPRETGSPLAVTSHPPGPLWQARNGGVIGEQKMLTTRVVDDQNSSYGREAAGTMHKGDSARKGRSLQSPNNARLLLRAAPTESGKECKTMWRQMASFRCYRWLVGHGGGCQQVSTAPR